MAFAVIDCYTFEDLLMRSGLQNLDCNWREIWRCGMVLS